MKLQVALDVPTLTDALELARQVAEHVDILELGTPLIKSEGVAAIGAIKARTRTSSFSPTSRPPTRVSSRPISPSR